MIIIIFLSNPEKKNDTALLKQSFTHEYPDSEASELN